VVPSCFVTLTIRMAATRSQGPWSSLQKFRERPPPSGAHSYFLGHDIEQDLIIRSERVGQLDGIRCDRRGARGGRLADYGIAHALHPPEAIPGG